MAVVTQSSNITISGAVPRQRIGVVSAGFLVATAAAVDGIQFGLYLIGLIPFIGQAIAIVAPPLVTATAWIFFFFWYVVFLNINIFSGRRSFQKALTFFGSAALEMVPLVSGLPVWTLGTIRMIVLIRHEDALYNKKHGLS